jgi:hypothetical protein
MDVVINELLCEQFGYDRDEIDPLAVESTKRVRCVGCAGYDNDLQGIDTDVERGQSFEYYYTRLPAKGSKCPTKPC